MDMQELTVRSQKSFEDNPNNIGCEYDKSPLVVIKPTSRLILDPIWNCANDDVEGRLHREYLKAHPGYDKLWLRQEVARRLHKASQNLPARLKLVLKAGHRPLQVQRKQLDIKMQKFLILNKN